MFRAGQLDIDRGSFSTHIGVSPLLEMHLSSLVAIFSTDLALVLDAQTMSL